MKEVLLEALTGIMCVHGCAQGGRVLIIRASLPRIGHSSVVS
jgi:hypothetical protein